MKQHDGTPAFLPSPLCLFLTVLANRLELAHFNALQYLTAKREGGYATLVGLTQKMIGRIIVRVDSPIKRITDLRGKTIFFLPPSGMSGHLKPKVPLLDHGLVAGHFVCEPLLGIPRPVRRELGFSVLTTGWDHLGG
jgi:hypothetical protein